MHTKMSEKVRFPDEVQGTQSSLNFKDKHFWYVSNIPWDRLIQKKFFVFYLKFKFN